MKNSSISLGDYFDQFVQSKVSEGQYKNVSEVIRAGLRLLENEENKVIALKKAIHKGIDSSRDEEFDFDENLKKEKMAEVILRQEAIDDLNSIWNYSYEKWSEIQADKYYALIRITCNAIGENPLCFYIHYY